MSSDDISFTPLMLALPSLTPSLAVEILPKGLTLHRLFVQADGRTHDLLVGPENPKDHLTQKYTNTIIGRYTNRVPVGPQSVTHTQSSLTSQISPVATKPEIPSVSLHGGPSGFDQAHWEPIPLDALSPDPESALKQGVKGEDIPGVLFSAAEVERFRNLVPSGAGALFRYLSKDGEGGYPGDLLVEVAVGLLGPQKERTSKEEEGEWSLGSVVLVYRAKIVGEGKEKVVTPVNLTQHWGFNLDASLKNDPEALNVKGHKLNMKASHTVEIDSEGLSTGNLKPVDGTHHSHSNKLIGDQFPEAGADGSLSAGYDHFYVFSPRETAPHRISETQLRDSKFDLVKDVLGGPGESKSVEPVVELSSEKSGLKLTFDTNQGGVQFYSYNFATGDGAKKKIHGGSGNSAKGEGYPPAAAAFLEFHEPLASFIHPKTNPSGNDTILGPGEVYNNFVRVDVLYKSPKGL